MFLGRKRTPTLHRNNKGTRKEDDKRIKYLCDPQLTRPQGNKKKYIYSLKNMKIYIIGQ